MRTRMYGGVTGKASDGLPMSIAVRFADSALSPIAPELIEAGDS